MLHRGTWLDANQIQNIRNRISNEGHKYYNAEGMLSGPIRRSKTFFMGGYQGFYENIPFPVTRTVPTELQRRGGFSQTFTAAGQPIIVYDPATTVCTGPSACTRQPFLGNVFPENRWHPIARALLPHLTQPNATPSNLAGSDNFVNSPSLGRYRYNSYLTRFDHVFSNTHRLSFTNTGNWGIEFRNENGLPEPAIRSDNYPTHRNHYLASVDDNVTLNSSTLWNTRVSWDRFDEPHDKQPLVLKGGLVFANRGGPQSPYNSDWNNVQARVGFTYTLTDWLVARTNYGRSYLGLSSGGQAGVYTTDFQRTTPFIGIAPDGVTPATPWATPFPAGFLQPLAGELGLLTAVGTGPTIPNPDYEIPYTDQWMAGVDVQLPWNIGLDVAYVGNKVSKLGVTRGVNNIPRSEQDKGIARLGGTPGYLTQTFPTRLRVWYRDRASTPPRSLGASSCGRPPSSRACR